MDLPVVRDADESTALRSALPDASMRVWIGLNDLAELGNQQGVWAWLDTGVLAGVPGAGVLDVEPMDPEDGGREPAVALAAFALVGGVVSLGLEP